MKKIIALLLITAQLTACVPNSSQNQYNAHEVGRNVDMEFGKIIRVREVKIQQENTGIGATGGMLAGAAAGSTIGGGDGQAAAIIGGLIIGAIAGGIAEQHLQNQVGYEYLVATKSKKVKKILQNQHKDDVVFQKGDQVMIETSGGFQRVLPMDDLPEKVKKPKGITVTD